MRSDFSFYYYGVLSSTNDKAHEFVKNGKSNLVVVAEKQENGRGRFGRKWNSQSGGLYMTIILKENDLEKIRYLTFIASISIVKTFNEISDLHAKVKWPNDVLIDGKKVCGILTEIVSGKKNYALVGIGANINQTKFPSNIKNKATSLKLVSNKNHDIKKLSKVIMKHFNLLYDHYSKKDYKKIINIWKKYSHTLGKTVKAKTLSGTYNGKAVDVDEECNLVLKLPDNSMEKIVEADIFVV
jgi:BirA family transcriptional regulator, biotin operon repressor / biotin---[acetyl-CoA-carboxylase] ligase